MNDRQKSVDTALQQLRAANEEAQEAVTSILVSLRMENEFEQTEYDDELLDALSHIRRERALLNTLTRAVYPLLTVVK